MRRAEIIGLPPRTGAGGFARARCIGPTSVAGALEFTARPRAGAPRWPAWAARLGLDPTSGGPPVEADGPPSGVALGLGGAVRGVAVHDATGAGAAEPALGPEGLAPEHPSRGHQLDQPLHLPGLEETGDLPVHGRHHVG